MNTSLKHILQALVRFCGDLILWVPFLKFGKNAIIISACLPAFLWFLCYLCSWCPDEKSSKQMVQVLFPLMYDATTEYLADYVSTFTV